MVRIIELCCDVASILSGFPALRVGSYVFGGSVFPAVFFFGDLRIFPPIFCWFLPQFLLECLPTLKLFFDFYCSFFFENLSNFVRLFGFHFFSLVFNGFSFGAKFVVSDFLLCIWNRFEKAGRFILAISCIFNILSSFVNLTVITSDFSYFYSHSFPLSWPDTLPFSCNQLPKSKSWFWQLIIKLWVLNWCTGFCECFLSNFNCIPCTLLNLILYCDKNMYLLSAR